MADDGKPGSRRHGGPGRRPKLVEPPPSLAGPNLFANLVSIADLDEIAKAETLQPVQDRLALPDIATAINDAFSVFVNISAVEEVRSAPKLRRDWCANLSVATREFSAGLGHGKGFEAFGRSAANAIETLELGWKALCEDNDLAERVETLFSQALPDRFVHGDTRDLVAKLDSSKCELFGRLGPMLQIVSTLADLAEGRWNDNIRRGGSRSDYARRCLVKGLGCAFIRLFGRKPEAADESPGFRWTGAVIACAKANLTRPGAFDGSDVHDSERCHKAAAAIARLAQVLAPREYKMETNGSARLDHWIRDALDGWDELPCPAELRVCPCLQHTGA